MEDVDLNDPDIQSNEAIGPIVQDIFTLRDRLKVIQERHGDTIESTMVYYALKDLEAAAGKMNHANMYLMDRLRVRYLQGSEKAV